MPGVLTSRRPGVFAFGKQTAVGTPLANPTYALPQLAGGMSPQRSREDLNLTRPTQGRAGQYITEAWGEGTITVLGHPDAIGLLLFEVCGGQSVSGASAPYTHGFTLADALPLPLTAWTMVANDWWKFQDTYVTRMALQGAAQGNVQAELGLVSLRAEKIAAAPTYSLAPDDPRFKYIDSDIYLDADGTTLVTPSTNVQSVELVIDRDPEFRTGPSLFREFILPVRNVDFNTTIFLDPAQQGWEFLEVARKGVAGAGEATQNLVAGSFRVRFGRHPSDATRYLEFESNGQNWEYDTNRPDPDPGGGAVEMDLAGRARDTGSGSEVELTLLNEVAAAY